MHKQAIDALAAAKATIHAEIQSFKDLRLRLDACIAQKERELSSVTEAHEACMRAASVRPNEFSGEQAMTMADRIRRAS